ncbi:MAG: hypothetical protein JWQ98_3587 [Chlorobi bacterium]|nr:hypothetical protein [Chlorobiota bacterium]
MNYRSEALSALLTAVLYLGLFVGVEIWSRRRHPDSETSRKLVHFGGGMIALLFPTLFQLHWSVLALAVAFFAMLIVTKRFGNLQSVQGVERGTVGEIIYPLAIWSALFLSTLAGGPAIYRIIVLILAVADALAGLVGKRFGRHRYMVAGGSKSVEGSATFFIATAAIIWGGLPASGFAEGVHGAADPMGRPAEIAMMFTAILVALLLTGVEAVSSRGIDNITVPLAAWCLLALVGRIGDGMIPEILLIVVAAWLALWLATRLRRLRVDHAILAVLAGYAIRLLALFIK